MGLGHTGVGHRFEADKTLRAKLTGFVAASATWKRVLAVETLRVFGKERLEAGTAPGVV